MKLLQLWAIFCGAVVALVIAVALTLAWFGYPELAHVAQRVALVISAIGVGFAALMAGIIVWCEVRGGVRAGEQRSAPGLNRASSRSSR